MAGLIKEQQFELALSHLSVMETKGIHVEDWLHSLLIYNLCDVGEYDEVYNLMLSRDAQGHEMTADLWVYVLSASSEVHHYGIVSYAWKRKLSPERLLPSDEVSRRVINMAILAGDTEFVNEIYNLYAMKGHDFPLDDVSELVEAHINSKSNSKFGRLASAFYDLCTMHKSGIPIGEKITSIILDYMIRKKIRPRDSWIVLQRFTKNMNSSIPMPLAKTLLKVYQHNVHHDKGAVDDGITLYKEMYSLCPEGTRDVTVFNSLIDMSRRGGNYQAAMFVINEMALLGIVRNSETFEHIILTCLDAKNILSASRYLLDMKSQGLSFSEAGRMRIYEKGLV